MDFLRRLLSGQPAEKQNTAAQSSSTPPKPQVSGNNASSTAAASGSVSAASTSETAPISEAAIPDTAPVKPADRPTVEVEARPAMFGSVDGVTRPLPQDAAIVQSGNEHLAFGQVTDVGMVRTNNQDAAFSLFCAARSADDWPDFGLFVVADGMGGHHDGEKASAVASRAVAAHISSRVYVPMLTGDDRYKQTPITELMVDAIYKANADIVAKVPDGGTTLTSVVVIGDLAYVAHVGDSRVYFMTRDRIEQLTRDHSLVQRLIELDQLTPEEAVDHPQKNVLYRALGQNESIEVDTITRRLPPRSRLLLCSDGLWNQVEGDEILDIVNNNPNLQEACNKLVALANARGGLDNVTVILLQLPG